MQETPSSPDDEKHINVVDNRALNHIPLDHRNLIKDDYSPALSLALSPSGHLYLYQDQAQDPDQEREELMSSSVFSKIQNLFLTESGQEDSWIGLLRLGVININTPLPPTLMFWQTVAQLFITEVRKVSAQNDYIIEDSFQISPPLTDLTTLMEQSPFMRGLEYLNLEVMSALWKGLCQALKRDLLPFEGNLQEYLIVYNPAWNKVGRVCFHLAENKADPDHPFAFLATYTVRLSTTSKVQHLPLERALKEYAGDHKRSHLLSLLVPVQHAAEQCPLIKNLVDTKSLFQPLAWRAKEAHAFLKSVALIEAAGVMVRVPNWWTPKNPPRPQVNIAIGNAASSSVGLDALLDFNMEFALPGGEKLTDQEWQELLKSEDPLVQIKGQWVEVDQTKITHVLSHWKKIERQVKNEGLSFAEGLRLLAAAPGQRAAEVLLEDVKEWSTVVEGTWLQEVLTRLRHPDQGGEDKILQATLQKYLKATLRAYQYSGVQWLWWLYNLKLGGCLADDMGLGKSIQVLSLLLLVKHHEFKHHLSEHQVSENYSSEHHTPKQQIQIQPHLLILPASLLANWQAEIKRFAPTLKVWVAHNSVTNSEKLKTEDIPSLSEPNLSNLDLSSPDLSGIDLVITTYGNVYRLPWISQTSWNMIILDEAQSIKNPTTKQALTIKTLQSQVRFILTGTPVENRLLDLWSLFDFVAPGLLGSSKSFSNYGKKTIQNHEEKNGSERRAGEEPGSGERRFYAAIRHLISPYILRRLKSDKSIISDLPDKTELNAYCFLTKSQATLYQKSVEELARRLNEEETDEMKRRGLVLSYLTRLKQICNHSNQWLGHGDYEDQDSGKFIRLKELCQSIALKQEKVLIFTQFREIIPALHETLKNIFGRSGLMLHGQTPIKERMKLVDAFQQEQGPPFFVLSLKAGGTGLNLTNAAHVIHFDRWWNPAVENQATDRAYRIGQNKNVLVHKFICQGTLEEKIDSLINAKKTLANELLTQEEERSLTELNNTELLNLISLDIHRALGETS